MSVSISTVAPIPTIPAAENAPEASGRRRDSVRLMVSCRQGEHHVRFIDFARFLRPGDLLVVNESATRKAAVDEVGGSFTLHFSTVLDARRWIVEFRRNAGRRPHRGPVPGEVTLPGGASLVVERAFNDDTPTRLWIASLRGVRNPDRWFAHHGRWIRYAYADERQGRDAWFQTLFAEEPGSAEMPSAGRAFTDDVVGRVRARGVQIAGLVHHCGVSSQDAGESPHPERYRVPAETRRAVRHTRRRGGRVVAVGTTVVRALETVERGGPLRGLTDLVIGRRDRVASVDGILSGFHPPDASHLALLSAVGGEDRVSSAYRTAARHDYRSHEFGDVHLLWSGRCG